MNATLEIVWINLKAIPQRLGLSLVIVVGLAGVVGVLTALLAMSRGFEATLTATGRADRAIVLRAGSQAELNSGLDRDSQLLAGRGPGVLRGADGQPLASGEMLVITELPLTRSGTAANVSFRGIEPAGLAMRSELKIVEGRAFQPGLREVIVGKAATRQFEGLAVGGSLRLRGADWAIVGIFATGDSHESEVWTDLTTAQSTFNRQGVSSVLVQLENEAAFEAYAAALKQDPRLNVDIEREVDYFSAQTESFRRQIGVLSGVVGVIMGIGAVFAALNTMFAAVAARAREIATLRAIGFGGLPVLASVLIEAMLLALAGGLLGAALVWLIFNNYAVTTLGQGFTQVVFQFRVTADLLLTGVLLSLAIGFIGGLWPALRAARLPVTVALREA